MNFQNQIDFLQEIEDIDMLDGVTVPAPLQAETLKSQIVFRCGLLDPAYSEPEIMRAAITQFFVRESWNIQHLVNIILAEYSPIENTDRYSEHTTEDEGEDSSTHSGTDTTQRSASGTDQRDIREGGTTTDTNEVSAYNAATYQPDNKETVAHGKTVDDDLTYGKTETGSTTYGHKITNERSGSSSYTEHTHGNIGVTTNQDMINQELELLRHFDVYDWTAAKLEHELFIQLY